jgi:acetyltransferase-like isoleucine patch superfamily enzyme
MLSVLFNLFRNYFRKVYYSFSTLVGYFQLFLSGVKFLFPIRFYGFPYFQRARTGCIKIGHHCSFRSSSTSNLIGINRPCIITVNSNASLEIGSNCGFSGTVIGCFSKIIIEDFVRCGANTLITDSDWHLDDVRSGLPKPICIKKNVWLGVNVTVLKGVTIGENSVIGAGSVVTRDIPDNVMAAGNPCQVLKSIL